MHVRLSGVMPPIPTPFDSQGQVAYDRLAENLERWNTYGLAGFVVLGSNGEAVYLNEREKLEVLETCRQVIPPDRLMVAGTGCESTRETIALTQQAATAGADVALLVTPHFYGVKMTPESLVRHYRDAADAAPIPIMIYNVPKFTNLDLDAHTIARMADHPNIIGVKDSGGNVAKVADIVRLAGADFQVLAGSAGFFLAWLTLGAVGGVMALANIAPQQCIEILQQYQMGHLKQAAGLQRRMVPVNGAITARFGVAGLKAALDMLGFYGGPVRPPLLDLATSELQALRATLIEGGVLSHPN